MDRPTDELVQRLLAVLTSGAAGDVARLVDDARAEAEAEVRELIKGAVKAVLLRRAVDHLERDSTEPPEPGTEPAPPPDGAPASAPRVEPAGESACYVYAITRTSWGEPPADLAGIDRRARLRSLRAEDLQAVVSDVSLDDFGPAVLEQRLKDLQWVEEKVRAHDAVVKALSAAGTVIPCRFCTILSGGEEVRTALTRHHDAIARTLDSLEGKSEWGVKLIADTRAAAPATAAPEGQADAGRAYLLQKKRQTRGRDDAVRAATEAAEACHRELFALSADAALLPTRDRGGADRRWHLALNAAYLVSGDQAEAFHAKVAVLAQQYRPQGLRIDLTGPWPPYNFSALNLSEAPAP
jgi:hypothetical protein